MSANNLWRLERFVPFFSNSQAMRKAAMRIFQRALCILVALGLIGWACLATAQCLPIMPAPVTTTTRWWAQRKLRRILASPQRWMADRP